MLEDIIYLLGELRIWLWKSNPKMQMEVKSKDAEESFIWRVLMLCQYGRGGEPYIYLKGSEGARVCERDHIGDPCT